MTVKLEVGQALLLEWHGEHHAVTVIKVGRKYATIGHPGGGMYEDLRLDMSDMTVSRQDGRGYGRCYRDAADRDAVKAAEAEERKAHKAWELFRRHMPYGYPTGVTAAAIRQAAALLGITLPEET